MARRPTPKKDAQENIMDMWNGALTERLYELEEEGSSTSIYHTVPVDIDTFAESEEYLGIRKWKGVDRVLSDPQREFVEKATDFENGVTDLLIWCGKGGGKNFVVSFMYCYIVYKLLCMRNPHEYFNHNPSKPLTLLNVAVNADTAKENFFNFVSTTIRGAGDKAFKVHGFDPDKHMGSTEIRFPKNILVKSGHSKAGGMEGYDLLVSVIDEVDAAEFSGVASVYQTLPSSASTRFGNKRKTVTISFRRYIGSNGMIKKLYETYSEREKNVGDAYARRYASWEFNHRPGLKESLEPEFDANPEMASCLYLSSDDDGSFDSWIKDTARIKSAMTHEGRSWIFDMPVPTEEWQNSKDAEFSYIDKNGEKKVISPYDIPIRERGIPGVKYVLAGDPGLGSVAGGGDGYGLTLAHREMVKSKDGKIYPRPVIDFSFRFTGRMFPEGEVQMEAVRTLITKLNKYGYNIGIYSFDGWNCLSVENKVLTPKGWVYVGEISKGDKVLSSDGKTYNTITSLQLREGTPSVRITLDNGLTSTSTYNHPYRVDGEWKYADDIQVNDRVEYIHEAIATTKENCGKPSFIDSSKVAAKEYVTSDIMNMEVDGDHTYLTDGGIICHNSSDTTQWIAKNYPGKIIYGRNLVETRDYMVLRDAIFSEAPPSKEGEKAAGGGISMPYHPILFFELKELRTDKCFIGETKIKSLDGNTYTLSELEREKKDIWVWSWDETMNGFVPKMATNARKTMIAKDIVKVTLDNGKEELCTPEHKWLLKSGEWVEAQYLKEGDALRALHFKEIGSSYYPTQSDEAAYTPTHRWVVNNFSQRDNTPSNLVVMDNLEHILLPSSLEEHRMDSDPTFRERFFAGTKRFFKTKYGKSVLRKNAENSRKVLRLKNEERIGIFIPKERRNGGNSVNKFVSNNGVSNSYIKSKLYSYITTIKELYEEFYGKKYEYYRQADGAEVPTSSIEHLRSLKERTDTILTELRNLIISSYEYGMSQRTLTKKLGISNSNFTQQSRLSWEDIKNSNHKVSSIEVIRDANVPVYDITVEGTENFLLESGVIVHNSKGRVDHTETSCFTGETMIRLSDGSSISFENAAKEGKDIEIVTYNGEKFFPKVGTRPRLTKYIYEVCVVTFSSGEKVRCTPDHRFLTKRGAWVMAQDMEHGLPLASESAVEGLTVEHVGIYRLEKPEPVYDLSVSLTECFLLEVGCVVHNSKDIADTVAKVARIINTQWPYSEIITSADAIDKNPNSISGSLGISMNSGHGSKKSGKIVIPRK